MHEGFVNFNAGTLGASMVEGRISAGWSSATAPTSAAAPRSWARCPAAARRSSRSASAACSAPTPASASRSATTAWSRPAATSRPAPRSPSPTWTARPRSSRRATLSGVDNVLFRRNSVTGADRGGAVEGRRHRAQRRPARQLSAADAMTSLRSGRHRRGGRRWRGRGGASCSSTAAACRAPRRRAAARRGRRPHGRPRPRAGRERRPDRRHLDRARHARPRGQIALATAFQESKLYNIEYGDRDSVGLFQQRPSQGWGTSRGRCSTRSTPPTPSTTRSPRSTATRDGDHRGRPGGAALGLPRGVRRPRAGRPRPRLGPDRQLAAARSGATSPGDADEACDRPRRAGLVPRAAAVRADLEAALRRRCRSAASSPAASRPATWRARRTTRAARSTSSSARSTRTTTAAAGRSRSYLVANADRLDIDTLIFDDRIWHAGVPLGRRLARLPRCRRRPAATGRSSSTATTCTWTSAATRRSDRSVSPAASLRPRTYGD